MNHNTFLATLLTGLFLSLGQATCEEPEDGGMIWMEGENADRHNFPPPAENPFQPQAFWENDLLSGGTWIGMLGKKEDAQPFLEFDIQVKSDGDYSLFVRKFSYYGNFRWRVDEAPWVEPVTDDVHVALETVPLREVGDRINLGWFYMGKIHLKTGDHTLRIEPLLANSKQQITTAGRGTPIAIDALVLTRRNFFPQGKLHPGEKYPSRNDRAFAFQPGVDEFASDSLDFRWLNEKFAGENGGITVKEGHLAHRNSSKSLRMVGVNYTAGRHVSPSIFGYLARSMAKRGINFMRIDIAAAVSFSRDAGKGLHAELQEIPLRNLASLMAALKSEGIYTALTWNMKSSKGFRELYDPGFAPPNPEHPVYDTSPSVDIAAIAMFDPELQDAYWQVWKNILNLELEGGTKIIADPALFLITLSQQSSLLSPNSASFDSLPATTQDAIASSWKKWVETRHGSMSRAAKAWQLDDPVGAEQVPEVASLLAARDKRARDGLRFLSEIQTKFYSSTVKKFREAGYRGLISCSNLSSDRPEFLGLAEMETRKPGDVIERHGNLRGDFVPKYDIWNFTEGALYSDRSMVALDTRKGLEASRFELPFKAPRYASHPSLLTEIGVALPNRFSGEFPLLAFALSSLQDVSALGFSMMSVENWQGSHTAARNQLFTPAIMGQMPALAYAFRQGLLPGPVIAGQISLTQEDVFSLQPAWLPEAPNSQINAVETPTERTSSTEAPDPALWTSGAIKVITDAKSPGFERVSPGTISNDGQIDAAGGQVRWNPQRRLFVVDSPSFQAVAGDLRDAGTVRLGAMEIRSPMENGVICAVSLDGEALDFSKKILVQIFSQESNAGFHALKAGDLSVVRSSGRPPLLVSSFSGEITFLRPDADELFATALDMHGNPLLPAGLGASLRFLPSTLYYLVEK